MEERLTATSPPDELLPAMLRRIPRNIRITFLTSFAAGLLAHLYVFTNKLVNHDEIELLISPLHMASSGRWLLHTASAVSTTWSMSWANGLLSVVYLSLAACFIIACLNIRRPLYCMLAAAFFITFPSVGSTFAYMACADAFFMSVLLAASAAYVAKRFRLGFLGSAALIACSLGIYQAYLSVTAALMAAMLLLGAARDGWSLPEIIARGLRYLAALLLGLAVYLGAVRLTTLSTPLSSYQGIDEMGKLHLSQLPGLVRQSYALTADFFLSAMGQANLPGLKPVYLLLFAAGVLLLFLTALRRKPGFWIWAAGTVLLAVYPLSCNLVRVMAPKAKVYFLMLFPLALLPILCLAAADAEDPSARTAHTTAGRAFRAAGKWAVVLCCLTAIGQNALFCNKAYFKLDLTYKQIAAYSNRLAARIEMTPGYTRDTPVILLGGPDGSTNPNPMPDLDTMSFFPTGVMSANQLLNSYSYGRFLQQFLSFTAPVYDSGSEQAKPYMRDEQIRSLPLYPAEGSVILHNGSVVVHFQNVE